MKIKTLIASGEIMGRLCPPGYNNSDIAAPDKAGALGSNCPGVFAASQLEKI